MIEALLVWKRAHTRNVVRVGPILILEWLVSRAVRFLIEHVEHRADDRPVVQRNLRRRIKKAFDQAQIEIPFPHIKVLSDTASRP